MTAVSACSSNDSKANDSKPSPTPSATQPTKPADPAETAKKDAIAAYQAYWQEMEKLYADSTGKKAELKQYAASTALKNAEADAKRTHDRNRVHIGGVTVGNPTVTKLDMSREVPNVTVSSCLDISRWQVVDTTTKKPVTLPSNRLTKYVIVTTVERWPEGWRVIRDEPQDKSC
ncbi:hypothetical protein [Streptomyces sp. 8N706]|uniref:hypothetical protein n=1 Tax=Streptomyces sp. 8N706 TaxID=3457416 RepID=UPI003FD35151